jgi:surface antigen
MFRVGLALLLLAMPARADTLAEIAAELRLDGADQEAARAAQTASLMEGRAVDWTGTGASGRVLPGYAWERDGQPCRAVSHLLEQAGKVRGWRDSVCGAPPR